MSQLAFFYSCLLFFVLTFLLVATSLTPDVKHLAIIVWLMSLGLVALAYMELR